MTKCLIILTCCLGMGTVLAQGTHKIEDVVYFVDSVKVDYVDFRNVNPKDIASLSVYKDSSAVELLGEEAKRGIIYIEMKDFSKNRVWNLLRGKSAEYKNTFPTPESDTNAMYILNGKPLTDINKGDLSNLTNANFKSVMVINRKKLKKDFKISNKEYGVVIETTEPKK